MNFKNKKNYLSLKLGQFRFYFRKRFRIISTANDILIGLFFVTGSILNLFPDTSSMGPYLYLAGSLLLLSRPILRIIHDGSIEHRQERHLTLENKGK
ncbi:YrhK family protein [Alkalicoccobacillus gibsonii]|uniref:YrhK family protein n=1 Tax=Alkalicoccobacillus gibsonii TaxID=79881 RepID=UPI003F7CCFEE